VCDGSVWSILWLSWLRPLIEPDCSAANLGSILASLTVS
jgi:hypothetical protein